MVKLGPAGGEAGDHAADIGVGDQVRAGASGRRVLGGGDEELAGCVQRVRVPSRGKHALPEDEFHVPALANAEADAGIHLRAHRALAHGFLGWPLGRGYDGDGQGAPEPRY